MASILDQLTSEDAVKFIDQVNEPFKNLPHLPKGVNEFFVTVTPWFCLIGAILGLVGGPLIALLGSIATLFTLNPLTMILTIVSAVVTVANSILLFMAFNPLKNRETKGWIYLFWSEILSLVSMLISLFDGRYGSIVGSIIGALIGLYFLFELRPFYGVAQSAVKKVEDAVK